LGPRDARAHEQQLRLLGIAATADRVVEVGVAAIDEDVAWGKQRLDLLNELIDRGSSLDHQHQLTGRLELREQVGERVIPGNRLALGGTVQEFIGFACRAIEDAD
jgi:hypothetical protein